jgi:hypothetical protein
MKRNVLIAVVVAAALVAAWNLRPRPPRRPMPPLPTQLDPKVVAGLAASYKADIEPIFKRSCFDCHSKFTVFPWYHNLPGVRQYLDGHIEEGRHDLELSDGFPFNREVPLMRHLRRIARVVKEKDMPLWDYALMHKDARMSQADRDVVVRWAEDGFQKLSATAKD